MDFRIFRGRLQKSKLIRFKTNLYDQKALGTQMFKMGSHYPFGYLKHKLWPKEGPQILFDSRSLKFKNLPDLLVCRWCATYHQKVLNKGYNFDLDLTSIGGFHKKLWASKVTEVPILGILGLSGISKLPIWESQDKMTFGSSPVARHKEYYKGEGGDFSQVQVVMSFVSTCLFVVCSCTKGAPTMH